MIRVGQSARDLLSETNFWAEMGDFRGKFEEILWMEGGEKLDPLKTQQIHGSNPTKHHQTNKSQKTIWGLFLVGIFGFRTKSTKSS